LCKQMIYILIWQHFCNCCIFYATKVVIFGISRKRFDTSSLQPVPESLIVFTKSQGLYVPASIKTLSTYTRKVPLLLHKKCNNCRNVAKLNIKSFVCTSLAVRICAVITQNYYRNIDEDTRKNSVSMQLSHNFNIYQYMQF
jgi:hypothetical protein